MNTYNRESHSTYPTVVESRLQALLFPPLNSDGSNFLEWIHDAKTVLSAEDLARTLQPPVASTSIDGEVQIPAVCKWQALLLLRRHLDQTLRLQYLEIDDPADLWARLHARFHHQQILFLPQARTDWINLRVLDFPDFASFNSELHRIVAQLRLCGQTVTDAELIEKTLSTFPPATAILSQQYRNMKFTTHATLMSHLLLAEKHQQLLLKNAESRPAREVHSTVAAGPARQAAAVEAHAAEASRRPPRGSYRKSQPSHMAREMRAYGKRDVHVRRDQPRPRPNPYKPRTYPPKQIQGNCHKCGRKGHFAKECRASPYTVNMYKELQQLRNQTRQTYNFENHNPNLPPYNDDVENYMTISGQRSSNPNEALLDSASTHTILTNPKFFHFEGNDDAWQHCTLITMAGSRNIKFREGRATVILPGGFPLNCERAMYAPDAPRSLISYRDLRARKIHVSTAVENDEEVLELRQGLTILATAKAGADGLYTIVIKSPDNVSPVSLIDEEEVCKAAWASVPNAFSRNLAKGLSTDIKAKPDIWHERLGHPGTTLFRRMIPLTTGHNLVTADAEKTHDCVACIQGKCIKRPSKWTLPTELPPPLFRLHGDICGPINPPSGTFRYYLVLVDASGSHFEVSLLPTRNMAFPRLLAILLRYRNHFPEHPIKYLRMDNAQEFRSHAFEDYCTATGITLTYSVPYEHAQNGLAEAFVKKIQLVARPLLLHAHLPSNLWGHAVLHAAALLRLRPTLLNTQTPYELLSGRPPDVSHIRVFGCQVWIPVPDPKRHTIGAHRQEGIYVGFDSPSIIRYLDPSTAALYKARFANCKFLEHKFPTLTLTSPPTASPLIFGAPETLTMNPDPPTSLANTEVTKLLNLKALAENTPDGFSTEPRIIRNPIPGTGNVLPRKRFDRNPSTSKPAKQPRTHYTTESLDSIPDSDPTTLNQAMNSPEWPHWKTAIETEYSSLRKHRVFGEISIDLDKQPIGHKLIFTRKLDSQGRVVRYKVRLVAQGFTQRPGIDYDQTYSPVMDIVSFRYLLALTVQFSLKIHLLDVVTAYLHGNLDTTLHLTPPPGFLKSIPHPKPGKFTGLRICKALYGLKQSGRAWYHHLCHFLISQGFTYNNTLPCIFTYSTESGFVILAVYVDDLNILGTPELCKYAREILTKNFDMKYLGHTTYCLGLQVHHVPDGGILLHQQAYVQKILKVFQMDQANPLAAPMIGRSKTNDDPYQPREEEEEIVDKSKYLTAVGAFTYLATHTRPDIAFATSILARHSQNPTLRHWNGVKHLLRYLRGTADLGLYYHKTDHPEIQGFADSGFRTDLNAGKSQTGYIFLKNGAPISWKSTKQTVTATSTNHAELLAFHEAARETVWLRTMERILNQQCKLKIADRPTIIYEDNSACVRQMSSGFIKADRTKHVSPHIFGFTQDLMDQKQLEIKKIESENNVADMLTKALPAYKHKKLIHAAGLRSLHELTSFDD